MKLAAKLALAAKDCGYVQKDGNNALHRYRYASAAAILSHVNDALHAHGLAVVDTLPEILSTEGSGKDRIVTARVTVTVADTESDERAVFRGLGSGMDNGDKAVMKAQTAALKYAWLTAFSISTGDDPEADESTDQRTTPSRGRSGPAQPRAEVPPSKPSTVRDVEAASDPAPEEVPAQLGTFYARIQEIDLPGEAVAVWIKHRADLAPLGAADRENAWKALCRKTEEVGKMKNAKVWLKKAIAEEDSRRQILSPGGVAA